MSDSPGKANEILVSLDARDPATWLPRILEGARQSGHPAGAGESGPAVRVQGLAGQHAILMGLDEPVVLRIDGPLGDYACAFNRQAEVRIDGSVGDGIAEGMISGAVRVRGNAGVGAGVAMRGGTLAIYGNVGPNCGAAMCGGELFVRGDVGPATAADALGGTIVIGGDAAAGLGDSMGGATIFIRGKASTLGRGARESPLRERERLRLGLLLINAGIRGEVKDFRRIVSAATLRGEAARPRSEIDPSWR